MGNCDSVPQTETVAVVNSDSPWMKEYEAYLKAQERPTGIVSIQQASDDRGSCVRFIKNAAEDYDGSTPEFAELRGFLTRCFVDCDTDFDGLIGMNDFDKLVERAGALPRKWGFAPTTQEMFATEESKKAFRSKIFKEIDSAGVGTFALDEWLNWCLKHIRTKAQYINYSTAETKMNTNKEEFIEFVVACAKSRHCPEYKELYHFLQDCFMKADKDTTGFITAKKFDEMIELAGAAPRKFGLAPPTNETYPSEAARLEARTTMFNEIVAKNTRSMSDQISFNAWLLWAYAHICKKAQELDSSLSGEPPSKDDLTNANYGGAKARSKLGRRGISVELASKEKDMFVKFIKNAAASKESPEYEELHYFLMQCFVECDLDFDGLIREVDFPNLVERAGALPRKWGFAPTSQEMMKNNQDFAAFRKKTFQDINKSKSGTIHFDEWLEWSYTHICEKAKSIKDEDAVSKMNTTEADFKKWVVAAAKDRSSVEYKELYHFLHECFMRADEQQTGLVDADGFDKMIELAGAAPRKFGLAPPTNKTYATDEVRKTAREEMFAQIAANNRRSFRDKIPFQSWLMWAYRHICAKAKELDPSLTGVPPGEPVPPAPEKPATPGKATPKKK